MMTRTLAIAFTAAALSLAQPVYANEPGTSNAVSLTMAAPESVPVEMTLTLTDVQGCASMREKRRDADYEVSVCRDGGEESTPVLAFEVERTIHGERGSEQRRFRVKARMALGKAVRVARYGEGKRTLEVSATVTRLESRS